MSDSRHFALLVLLAALAGLVAVLANRLTERIRVPVPALVLIGAAIVARFVHGLHPSERLIERLVTVALVCILFDGGRHIGWARARPSLTPIVVVGVAGTFLTAAGGMVLVHLVTGFSWYLSLLIATALAPTDPAVVFAVLGRREVVGRSGTIIEGESGANDPVGIALVAGLLAVHGLSGHAFGHVALEFVEQMAIGLAVGAVGAFGVTWFVRHVALPSAGLHPLRMLACAFAIYGLATIAHGSGFLAVFVAGIALGDVREPYRREVEHFHAALAGLAEIVAFIVFGLSVDLNVLGRSDVWVPGLVIGAGLALVVRPLAIPPCLIGSGLRRNEVGFIVFAGLKGAVPLLLGRLVLASGIADGPRGYGIVVVAVLFSVILQGSLVPTAARVLRVPMTRRES